MHLPKCISIRMCFWGILYRKLLQSQSFHCQFQKTQARTSLSKHSSHIQKVMETIVPGIRVLPEDSGEHRCRSTANQKWWEACMHCFTWCYTAGCALHQEGVRERKRSPGTLAEQEQWHRVKQSSSAYCHSPVKPDLDSGNEPTSDQALSMASSTVHMDGCSRVSHLEKKQANLYMVSHHNENKTQVLFHGLQSLLNLNPEVFLPVPSGPPFQPHGLQALPETHQAHSFLRAFARAVLQPGKDPTHIHMACPLASFGALLKRHLFREALLASPSTRRTATTWLDRLPSCMVLHSTGLSDKTV